MMSGHAPYEEDQPGEADPFSRSDSGDGGESSFLEDVLSEPIESATSGSDQCVDLPASMPMPRSYVPSSAAHTEIAATEIRCTGCGYNLTGVTIGGTCPECGKSVSQSILMGSNQITSGLAVASMVMGIIAVITGCFPFLGGILPLGGLPLGIIGLSQAKSGTYTSASRGMAIAGIITNSVALTIQGLMLFSIFA